MRAARGRQFAKGLDHRVDRFSGAIVRSNKNQRRAGSALPIWNEKGFSGGDQARQTDSPRRGLYLPPPLFEIKGRLLEPRALFHVRQDFADERKDHSFILPQLASESCPSSFPLFRRQVDYRATSPSSRQFPSRSA